MRIAVCIKQVPDTETKVKITSDSNSIDETGIKWIVNPYDEFAIEEAIKLKEANAGSTVTVFTLGPKRSTDALRTALAMGADDAVLIECNEKLDVLSTAQALAAALKAEQAFDLLLTGKLAIDDNAASVPQMLAELLEIPHATVVSKLECKDGLALAEREVEGGTREIIELKLPAVIAANKGLNTPRYASLPGIMKAKKKPLKEVPLASLNISSNDNKTTVKNFQLPPEKPPVKMLSGESVSQAKELVRLLREEAKVI